MLRQFAVGVVTNRGWLTDGIFVFQIPLGMPAKQRMRIASQKHSQNVVARGNVPKTQVLREPSALHNIVTSHLSGLSLLLEIFGRKDPYWTLSSGTIHLCCLRVG